MDYEQEARVVIRCRSKGCTWSGRLLEHGEHVRKEHPLSNHDIVAPRMFKDEWIRQRFADRILADDIYDNRSTASLTAKSLKEATALFEKTTGDMADAAPMTITGRVVPDTNMGRLLEPGLRKVWEKHYTWSGLNDRASYFLPTKKSDDGLFKVRMRMGTASGNWKGVVGRTDPAYDLDKQMPVATKPLESEGPPEPEVMHPCPLCLPAFERMAELSADDSQRPDMDYVKELERLRDRLMEVVVQAAEGKDVRQLAGRFLEGDDED
jgi:hypothetical protein